ncbi:MATE family efflux transporter [Oleomonas cavernae]|uniref:MATE family efflux transporter n=1 Tax=Oleomonas cavernae TaxID=2320859 RepID=A0A418WF19_9PROT|nr:MATE family efflux transporter [Oleomonas cavernae]RJF88618.1 MATE family efflux transporter [Oleomonas cavernae]
MPDSRSSRSAAGVATIAPSPGQAALHPPVAVATRTAKTLALLERPIGSTLARLAVPNILAMLVTAAGGIAEAAYAGMLGVEALAGLALVFPFVMLTQMLSGGSIGGAISAAIARALGKGDMGRAERLMLHVVVISIVAAMASAILFSLFGRGLLELLGGRGQVLAAAAAYAGVFFPGCIAIWLCNSTLCIVRGTGDMAAPSTVLFAVTLSAIPLSGALALGWGVFPAFGMAGLAAGLVIPYGLGAVTALGYIAAGRIGLGWSGAWSRLEGALFRDILGVGLTASVSSLQTVLTVIVMVGLVGQFGEGALAGYGIGARLEFLMIPIVFGIGAAMTAMVGANIGAGQHERALAVAWTGSLAAATIVGAIGITFAVFPDLWLGGFLNAADAAALDAGRLYFRIVAPFYAFFALGLALYFASQGAGRVLWPVIAGLLRLAIAVGGGFLLTHWLDVGLAGVLVAVAAGMAAFGATTAAAIRLTRWR